MTTDPTNVTILLAEDNEGHAELILEQLRSAGLANEIIRFQNGQVLWEYLVAAGRQTPPKDGHDFLLLLDIVMPKIGGLEVLRRIKTDKHWHNLPVIMLTTTDDPREIDHCQALGCSCYITKPMEYENFTEMLRRLGLFLLVVQSSKIKAQGVQGG